MSVLLKNTRSEDISDSPWKYTSTTRSILVTRKSGGARTIMGQAMIFVDDGEIIAANVQRIGECIRNVVACNSTG